MWVNRHKLNNSLVVFVHGILGNRWATWKGVPDLLQRQFEIDALLRSYDFYLFQYDTSFVRQPALNPYVLGQLDDFLGRVGRKYQTTVLIAHSQGGILAKLYVIRKLLEGNGQDLTVDLILTFGTPHLGIRLLNPLHWLHRPLISRFLPFRQLAQLASRAENIRTLKENWTQTLVSPRPILPTSTRRHIRSVAVVGAYDRWVGERSAAGFSIDIRRYMTRSHSGLAKPQPESDLADLVLDQLRDHLRPDAVLKAIRSIASDKTESKRYFNAHAAKLFSTVRLARPGLGGGGLHIKTASLMMDFLHDFPERPMRCLTLDDALLNYAQRQLGEEL